MWVAGFELAYEWGGANHAVVQSFGRRGMLAVHLLLVVLGAAIGGVTSLDTMYN